MVDRWFIILMPRRYGGPCREVGGRIRRNWGPLEQLFASLAAVVLATSCGPRRPVTEAVVIGAPYEMSTLDPHAEDTLSAYAILGSLYEPLVTADGDLRSQPCLAMSWTNPDALTWIFRLRPNVRFHSGRPLRARDVVYSLERPLKTPRLGVDRHIAGIAAIREKDPLTVEIQTRVPDPVLLSQLRLAYIVPEGADARTLGDQADGTGPFALESWTPTASVRLIRNEKYWGTRAALRHVEYRLGHSPEEAVRGLIDGRYGFVQANSRITDVLADRFAIRRRQSLYLKFLAFDISRDATPHASVRANPFKDVRVRRAIHLAIDRRQLVASVDSDAIPSSQMVPRFVFGFNPAIPDPVVDTKASRDLLRQAGLAKGFSAVFLTRRILAEPAGFLKAQLARVGIVLDLRIVPDAEFFVLLNRRDASFWMERYGCATGDAGEALANLLHSKDPARHLGIDNDTGLALPDLDQAIESSAVIEKTADRQIAIQTILERVTRDLLLIPLYSDSDIYAMDHAFAWSPRADSFIRGQDIVPSPR